MSKLKSSILSLGFFFIGGSFVMPQISEAEKLKWQKFAADLVTASLDKDSDQDELENPPEVSSPDVGRRDATKVTAAVVLASQKDSEQNDIGVEDQERADAENRSVVAKKPLHFTDLKPEIRKIIFDDLDKLKTVVPGFGRMLAKKMVKNKVKTLIQDVNHTLSLQDGVADRQQLFCDMVNFLETFLDPMSNSKVSGKLTKNDVEILKGTGKKVLDAGDQYPFVRFVKNCHEKKMSIPEFRASIKENYGVCVDQPSTRSAGVYDQTILRSIEEVFTMLCQ